MRDVPSDAGNIEIIVHNDDTTPYPFVVNLLKSAFGFSEAEAAAFATKVNAEGQAACGRYPKEVADALLKAASTHIKDNAHPLTLEARSLDGSVSDGQRCIFCGKFSPRRDCIDSGENGNLCSSCILAAASSLSAASEGRQFRYVHEALAWFFAGIPQDQLLATARQFPGHMRADVQVGIDRLMARSAVRFVGIFERHRYETLTFATLTEGGQNAPTIAAAQYQDVDVGGDRPTRCLENGLWLCRAGDVRYAVVLSFHREFGVEAGLRVEIAVPAGEAGSGVVAGSFSALEEAVNAARSYRGKVLSLDGDANYLGRTKGMMVHRLPPVARDEVILPAGTLDLLDRSVLKFVGSREALRRLGQSTCKGILLYGPPGTGKTHTIRYLASNLPGHTTLLITAGQVAYLGQYMTLARLLQPALVVIEDVDLIARDREHMSGPCEESLLNRLLNEMDGLKQEADILFILTTNRPEQLEAALAGRPGRIDQAIEVPLPDEAGRGKLVQLYGKGQRWTLRLRETRCNERKVSVLPSSTR